MRGSMGVFASPTEQQARLSKRATVERSWKWKGGRPIYSSRRRTSARAKKKTSITTANSHHLPEKQRLVRERDRREAAGQYNFRRQVFPAHLAVLLGLLVRPSRRHGRCRFPPDKGTFDVGGPVGAFSSSALLCGNLHGWRRIPPRLSGRLHLAFSWPLSFLPGSHASQAGAATRSTPWHNRRTCRRPSVRPPS